MRLLRGELGAAHVELISSSPTAGSNLSSPPGEVTISFDDELDPGRSSFTVAGGGAVEVGTGEVDLTVADRNVGLPLVVVMIGYTVLSLWIIAQPITIEPGSTPAAFQFR